MGRFSDRRAGGDRALAPITFVTVHWGGMVKFGRGAGFWIGQVPHMDVPLAVAIFVKPMIFVLEVFGLCVRHAILAVRLFANMFAGHLVLAVVVGVYRDGRADLAWYGVMPAACWARSRSISWKSWWR